MNVTELLPKESLEIQVYWAIHNSEAPQYVKSSIKPQGGDRKKMKLLPDWDKP